MEYTSKEVYEYVSRKTNDSIVEWKKCHTSWQDFPIYKSDLEFYDKVSPRFEVSEEYAKEFLDRNSDVKDNFEYKDWKLKAKIPTPNLCPEERYIRKLAFRNELNLYKRKCSMTWKNIISIYSPDKEYSVYDQNVWWSDKRDPLVFGQKVNSNKRFFEQFNELFFSVPMISLQNISSENSEYCTLASNNKNCYLIVWNTSENCCYGRYWTKNVNCLDYFFSADNTNCYEIIDATDCYEVFFSQNTKNCQHSYFLKNCQNCSYCFWCINLSNKKYYIYNSPVSKEAFEDFIEKNLYDRNFINKVQEKIKKLEISLPRKNMNITNSDKRSFWNNLSYAENVQFWFDSVGSESTINDCKYINLTTAIKDCHDIIDSWNNSSLCYDSLTFIGTSILFSTNIFDSHNILYCNMCHNCNNCFWCVWLRNKSYCILNKQYSMDEYNQLIPNIIANMIREWTRWSFFPIECSPFWYNETIAMLCNPLTKEEVLEKWYRWSDYESLMPNVEKIVQWKDLPTQWCRIIKEKKPDILEKILNYAVICEVSKKPFRITKQEIEFYAKYNIPLPTKHPDIRNAERLRKRDSSVLCLTNCNNCWEEILSIHKPWKWEKILCEKCFYDEI